MFSYSFDSEYESLSLHICKDIVKNGRFDDDEIVRVFQDHIERNKNRLDMVT